MGNEDNVVGTTEESTTIIIIVIIVLITKVQFHTEQTKQK